ncbi:hypothetical protein [Actinacidiphila acididurans]|uniref:C2H2-type domain-containing protein n=1 Tax=Actinacidiphila acididurans TaxID=2784346 RepID=A0ABS2U5E8_9ACTN|nr:hypothetical protein [Actinacidiphila acididurans]MBM9509936.1 hypothetical protein [Actinacidiphila acididurans]
MTAALPVPVPVQVTRYKCPFCTRSRSRKQAIEQHIARCWHNPEVRACKTCTHYEPPEPGPYPEHPGWPESCGAADGPDRLDTICTGCPLWQAPTSKEEVTGR